MGKVSFDSTSTIKEMIFQFLVALERCFEMQEGQSVYIERFGDVSVIGKEDAIQIESKYFKRDLSDLDENVWNSISNWADSSFSLEEFITEDTHKTVWVIHIPKHQPKLPVYAHNKAWQRLDDSLIELTDSRRNAILDEQDEVEKDWSSQIIHDATIDDLDSRAVAKAKEKFIELHSERETEIKAWDDATFLNKAKLTIKGQITNSTIILLGREESEHFFSPAVCKIRWMRKKNGTEESGSRETDIMGDMGLMGNRPITPLSPTAPKSKLLLNSHELVGNYNTLLGRAKRQSRASEKL